MIYMKENGIMIKQKDLEFIYIMEAQNTKDIGKMISSMEEVLKHGLMELHMKEIL